jgi:hypothetical protein
MDQSTNSQSDAQTGIMARLKDGAAARVSEQKDAATKGLGSIAQAARQTTQQLRDGQHETIAEYIEKAADNLEKFSSNLSNRSVAELMSDVQQFARRQPALFVGAAFAAGLLAARFLKSSNNGAAFARSYDRASGDGSARGGR